MYKLSKLIPEKYLRGSYSYALASLVGRCTGASTGLALQVIGKALANPMTEYEYPDEAQGYKCRERMRRLVVGLLHKLELQHFELTMTTIKYKPYKYVDSNGKEVV